MKMVAWFLASFLIFFPSACFSKFTAAPPNATKDVVATPTVDTPPIPNAPVKLLLDDMVSEEMVTRLIKQIQEANKKNAPYIEMLIDSPGGSVFDGIKLARAMETSEVPVVCIVDGMAASMAFYLLQSCGIRMMTKRSVLMAHQVSAGVGTLDPQTAASAAEALKAIDESMAEHAAARMKISVKEFLQRTHALEWWFNWRDATKYGAVDEVLESPNKALRSFP